jgi:hypothetical protein
MFKNKINLYFNEKNLLKRFLYLKPFKMQNIYFIHLLSFFLF